MQKRKKRTTMHAEKIPPGSKEKERKTTQAAKSSSHQLRVPLGKRSPFTRKERGCQ